MNLKLDPPSGFSDSYLDIEFIAKFNKAPKSIFTLYNDTFDQQLDIIGVGSGYILEGNTAVVKNSHQLRGHFNIFNHDKMNEKFRSYASVSIRCKVEHFNEDNHLTGVEEESLIFYNESHSLDSEIIPFDLIMHNKTINLDDNEPLKIDLISGIPKYYVLCIRSADKKSQCHFEISAKKGRTTINIPASFITHDLELSSHRKKKFDIYYVLYQGATFSRLANRKYIKIDNTDLDFLGDIGIKPQVRKDPAGRTYSNKFILSDRYLVLCPREYSGFSGKSEFGPGKLMDLTMLVYEGQHMENLSKELKQFSSTNDSSDKISKTKKLIAQRKHVTARKIRPKIPNGQIQLMQGVSGVYEAILSRTKTTTSLADKITSFTTAPQTSGKQGCLPCSRKINNA